MERGRRPVGARLHAGRAWIEGRTPPLGAGAQSRLGRLPGCGGGSGTAPHSGAVVPREALKGEGPASPLHGGMFWRSCGAESAGARLVRGSGSAGVPQAVSARQVSRGALPRAAPPGAGEEDGSGQWGRTRRRGGGPRHGEDMSGRVELRPLARGPRGGREALALTSWGPAGDGGSGHSTPHRPPPAPADSGVRRQCARGGASQIRGRGSGRELGGSTRKVSGGALA